MAGSEVSIVTPRRLSLFEWQHAIDAQGFFIELKLTEPRPGAPTGRWHASLGGQSVDFRFDERPVAAVLGDGRAPGTWRHAFATPGSGDLASCAAGGMAIFAYAVATEGAFWEPGDGPIQTFGRLKEALDVMAAVVTGKAAEYEAAHPSEQASGSDDIVITMSRLV